LLGTDSGTIIEIKLAIEMMIFQMDALKNWSIVLMKKIQHDNFLLQQLQARKKESENAVCQG